MNSRPIDNATRVLLLYFDYVIGQYISTSDERFIPGTLFVHKHGKQGVERANKLRTIWQEILTEITEGHADLSITDGCIQGYATMELRRLMADKRILPGDYKRHSLKAYVLAYCLAMEQWIRGHNVEALFKAKLTDLQNQGSKEIERRYHETCLRPLDQSNYEFHQLTRIVLSQLHKKMKLEKISSDGADWTDDASQTHHVPYYCEFSRPDKVRVVYFYPVIDAGANSTANEFLSDPDNWFSKTYPLIADPSNKIVIIPVKQIRHDANYFVTVVAYENRCYVIEPASMLSGLFSRNTFPKVTESVCKDGSCETLYVNQQGMLDKADGGLHHINYAIELATLALDSFSDSNKVLETLRKTKLYFRDHDDKALTHDLFYQNQYLTSIGNRGLNGALQFGINEYVNNRIKDEEFRCQRRALTHVRDELSAYITAAKEGGHVRGEMAAFLLEKINEKLDEDENLKNLKKELVNYEHGTPRQQRLYAQCDQPEQSRRVSDDDLEDFNQIYTLYKKKNLIEALKGSIVVEAALVLSCYRNIDEDRSALRKALERSLVLMLHCEDGYKEIWDGFTVITMNMMNDFFAEQLKRQMNYWFDDELYRDYLDDLVVFMHDWNNASASFHARHIEKPDDRTKHQDTFHKGVNSIEVAYEKFKVEAMEAKGHERAVVNRQEEEDVAVVSRLLRSVGK